MANDQFTCKARLNLKTSEKIQGETLEMPPFFFFKSSISQSFVFFKRKLE